MATNEHNSEWSLQFGFKQLRINEESEHPIIRAVTFKYGFSSRVVVISSQTTDSVLMVRAPVADLAALADLLI